LSLLALAQASSGFLYRLPPFFSFVSSKVSVGLKVFVNKSVDVVGTEGTEAVVVVAPVSTQVNTYNSNKKNLYGLQIPWLVHSTVAIQIPCEIRITWIFHALEI
jgi:hypothetical protein